MFHVKHRPEDPHLLQEQLSAGVDMAHGLGGAAANKAKKETNAAGRNARNPGGLAEGRRPMGLQLLPDLVAQAADRRVVEVDRQLQSLVPAIGRDVLALATR